MFYHGCLIAVYQLTTIISYNKLMQVFIKAFARWEENSAFSFRDI